jgi:hypothetical protein
LTTVPPARIVSKVSAMPPLRLPCGRGLHS